eukprot:tig00000704_g3299.t1
MLDALASRVPLAMPGAGAPRKYSVSSSNSSEEPEWSDSQPAEPEELRRIKELEDDVQDDRDAVFAQQTSARIASKGSETQLAWGRAFLEYGNAFRDEGIAILCRLIGRANSPDCVKAVKRLTELLQEIQSDCEMDIAMNGVDEVDDEDFPPALSGPALFESLASALAKGSPKIRLLVLGLASQISLLVPGFVLSEELYGSGLLDLLIAEAGVSAARVSCQLAAAGPRERKALWPASATNERLKAYAPRPRGARAGPVPEDQSGLRAAESLKALLAGPVPAPAAAPELSEAPPAAGRLLWALEEGSGPAAWAAAECRRAFLECRTPSGKDPIDALVLAMSSIFGESWESRMANVGPARRCCLSQADGPDEIALEQAVEARGLVRPPLALPDGPGAGSQELAELGGCLLHLSADPEAARALLPHAPALRHVLDECHGEMQDPRLAFDRGGVPPYAWKNPLKNAGKPAVTCFCESLLHAMLALHARLESLYPSECPKLDRRWGNLAGRQAENVKEEANRKFKKGEHTVAALLYGTAIAFCPSDRRETLAALYGNRAQCLLNLGGRARLEDAGRDAAASLGHAEACGDRALAAKARQRLAAAREALAALEA